MAQDPLGILSANHWEEKLFDQSRSIEPKDGPVKTAVSSVALVTPLLYNIVQNEPVYTVGALRYAISILAVEWHHSVAESSSTMVKSPMLVRPLRGGV